MPDQNRYTCEQFYDLPNDRHAEMIDGTLYDMAPPSRIHQKLLSYLNTKIFNYIESKGGDCEVYPAPFAVKLDEDHPTIVEPDISVICDKDKLDNRGCNGAPDWIIEIVSPSNQSYDYITKLNLYKQYGVREYWIVNPMSKNILVYFFESDIFGRNYTFDNVIKANIYQDLFIDFSVIES